MPYVYISVPSNLMNKHNTVICHLISCPVFPAYSFYYLFPSSLCSYNLKKFNRTSIFNGWTSVIGAWCCHLMKLCTVMGILMNFWIIDLPGLSSAKYQSVCCSCFLNLSVHCGYLSYNLTEKEQEEETSTLKKKVAAEKKQREHLLQLNQILAKQVMEKSKMVAGK